MMTALSVPTRLPRPMHDFKRVAVLLLACLIGLATSARAAPSTSDPPNEAEELRLLVAELEARETPPDQAELERLKELADRLQAALDEQRADDEVPNPTSEEVKEARWCGASKRSRWPRPRTPRRT